MNKSWFKKGVYQGHGFKKGNIPWSKGKTNVYSEETLEKFSNAKTGNKNASGHSLSQESIELMKKGEKEYYSTHSAWNKGIPCSEESKRKIRESHNRPETIQKIREARMKRKFPIKDTKIEVALQSRLTEMQMPFVTHKPILNITQPDIFIEPNVCIFADGCWWHGCEKCFDRNYFLNSELGKRILLKKLADDMINVKLLHNNYKVLRFWEHDIKNNFEDVLDKIIFAINENKEIGEKTYG